MWHLGNLDYLDGSESLQSSACVCMNQMYMWISWFNTQTVSVGNVSDWPKKIPTENLLTVMLYETMLKILALGVILGVSIKLIRVLPYLGNCENLKTLEYNNVK